MIDNQDIANNLRELRIKYKYSQSQTAKKLGLSQSAYSMIEAGKNRLQIEYLVELSILYNTSVDRILNLHDKNVRIGYESGFIPLLEAPVHATFLDKSISTDLVDFKEWYKIPGFNPSKGHILFEVEGDSMSPTILDNDILICQPVSEIKDIIDGSLVLVVTKTEITVARLRGASKKGRLRLEKDNKESEESIEEIVIANVVKIFLCKGKITSKLIPYLQVTSKGKISKLEEHIKSLQHELFALSQKVQDLTDRNNP